jgi:outer membrane protein OmpA-like peptidoglycan-associated protein
VVLNPRFTVLSNDDQLSPDASTIFMLTAGPRLTAGFGDVELFVTGQGGLYTDVTGPFDDTGGGWNAGGGVSYYLVPGRTSFGVMARYDSSDQTAAPGSSVDREILFAGFTVQHRYLPEEPAVEPVAVAPAAAPVSPPSPKKKLVLRGVHFDFDRATLRPDARPVLDEAIAALKENAGVDVDVEGYTDDRGTEAYNQKLSERRARTVADYLTAGGIAGSRLTVQGFGESKPVASNATPDGRAQNRRVELGVE